MSTKRSEKHAELVNEGLLKRVLKHHDKMYNFEGFEDRPNHARLLPKYSGTKYRGRNRYDNLMESRYHISHVVRYVG